MKEEFMRFAIAGVFVAWGGLCAGCGAGQKGPEDASGAEQATQGSQMEEVTVALQPTQGYETSGELSFVAEGDKVVVRGTVTGLTPNSKHGFHIHQYGDCSAPDASSAGDHFAPEGNPHGEPQEGEHHAGDMKNLEANAAGVATVEQELQGVSLGGGGDMDIVGRAVIVHLAPDDYRTQPSGGSGARIACGVIQQKG
jgi:Cu-Zn family superoxide dismutase